MGILIEYVDLILIFYYAKRQHIYINSVFHNIVS